jgi:hypothetical protein
MSVDFQRFESVRARQRSERRRWLSLLSALAVIAVIVAVIQVAGPATPGWAGIVQLLNRGASLVVEARGRVEVVERETRTIRIASGFLGLTSVALVVTENTLIVVGEKEGGFGDIRPGEPVIAAYEIGHRPLQAMRVEVVLPARAPGP